jgi:uncharacterized protein
MLRFIGISLVGLVGFVAQRVSHPLYEDVSSDPASRHFSMSFGGQAIFVVGLHLNARRTRRRFRVPAMVLNAPDQFEQLREQGGYDKLQSTILERDKAIAGRRQPDACPSQ